MAYYVDAFMDIVSKAVPVLDDFELDRQADE